MNTGNDPSNHGWFELCGRIFYNCCVKDRMAWTYSQAFPHICNRWSIRWLRRPLDTIRLMKVMCRVWNTGKAKRCYNVIPCCCPEGTLSYWNIHILHLNEIGICLPSGHWFKSTPLWVCWAKQLSEEMTLWLLWKRTHQFVKGCVQEPHIPTTADPCEW